MSTSIPLIPGLYTALTTPLGTFLNADRVRRECQDSWTGVFVHPIGKDGVVLARVVGGTPEGGRYAGELARMAAPERLESAVDALRYAERISERITAEGWDVSLSLAVLRAQANGIAGWIGGGVQVWNLQDDNNVVPCSPPQTLQLPPGMSIGLDPSTIVQSGVARGFATGEWFEATGQRFAIVLCKPTLVLSSGDLGPVASTYPSHMLQRIGSASAKQGTALIGYWDILTRRYNENDILAHLASIDGGPSPAIATTWAQLLDPALGLTATCVELIEENASAPTEQRGELARQILGHTPFLATISALSGSRLTRSLLAEYCQAFARCVPQRFSHPSLIEAQPATQALTIGLLARSCGVPFDNELNADSWLEVLARDNSRTESSFELGLLTLAYGHPEHLPLFIFGTTPDFEPGQRFGFNTQGFTHYLAAAMKRGAGFDDVAPAWREFVTAFPHKLAAQTLHFSGLLAAAYVVHHRIQGRPEKHVVDVLSDELRN